MSRGTKGTAGIKEQFVQYNSAGVATLSAGERQSGFAETNYTAFVVRTDLRVQYRWSNNITLLALSTTFENLPQAGGVFRRVYRGGIPAGTSQLSPGYGRRRSWRPYRMRTRNMRRFCPPRPGYRIIPRTEPVPNGTGFLLYGDGKRGKAFRASLSKSVGQAASNHFLPFLHLGRLPVSSGRAEKRPGLSGVLLFQSHDAAPRWRKTDPNGVRTTR